MSGSLWVPSTDVAGDQATIAANKRWQSRLFASSGTWTVPADVGVIWVEGCAGGGGGAGGDPTPGGGGGGGCSGEVLSPALPTAVTPSETLTLTVGAAGLGGAIGANGGFGGLSSIVGNQCALYIFHSQVTALKGNGTTGGAGAGFNANNPSSASGGASGAAGTASSFRHPAVNSYYGHPYFSNMPRFSGGGGGGGLNANGGLAYEGNGFSARNGGTGSPSGGGGGAGGSNPFGAGGLGGNGGAAGGHATGYGAGGGGGGGNAPGGNGSPGFIRIYCLSSFQI